MALNWPLVGGLSSSIDSAIWQRIDVGIGIHTLESACSLAGGTRVSGNPSALE